MSPKPFDPVDLMYKHVPTSQWDHLVPEDGSPSSLRLREVEMVPGERIMGVFDVVDPWLETSVIFPPPERPFRLFLPEAEMACIQLAAIFCNSVNPPVDKPLEIFTHSSRWHCPEKIVLPKDLRITLIKLWDRREVDAGMIYAFEVSVGDHQWTANHTVLLADVSDPPEGSA